MSAAELSKALRDTAKKVDDARYDISCASDGGDVIPEHRLTSMARDLYHAGELIRCLSRMVEGKSIHRAFGAPGDFGYESIIGAALSNHYNEGGAA